MELEVESADQTASIGTSDKFLLFEIKIFAEDVEYKTEIRTEINKSSKTKQWLERSEKL